MVGGREASSGGRAEGTQIAIGSLGISDNGGSGNDLGHGEMKMSSKMVSCRICHYRFPHRGCVLAKWWPKFIISFRFSCLGGYSSQQAKLDTYFEGLIE